MQLRYGKLSCRVASAGLQYGVLVAAAWLLPWPLCQHWPQHYAKHRNWWVRGEYPGAASCFCFLLKFSFGVGAGGCLVRQPAVIGHFGRSNLLNL